MTTARPSPISIGTMRAAEELLGYPAFTAMVVVFALMVMKPL